MAFEEILGQAIEAKFKQTEKMVVTTGTVKTVREIDCDVTRAVLPELLGVRYHAIVDGIDNYVRIIPKQGSHVLCAIIEGNVSEAIVIGYSEVEQMECKIQGAELVIKDGKFTVKNESADLKRILETGFETLIKATILTPSGPGNFSPAEVAKFEEQKQRTIQLFN